MRQAINNLQSTHSGFGFVSQDNVFKICDQPHPITVRKMIKHCQKGEIDDALTRISGLWDQGYSAVDIVVTVFRVVKGMEELPEYTRLEFIRVSACSRGGGGGGGTAHNFWKTVKGTVLMENRRSAGHTCGYSRESALSYS